jgi:lipopolysaccharide export system protein LptC
MGLAGNDSAARYELGMDRLLSVSTTAETQTHAWRATTRRDRERVFDAARRHSRWVRFMRVGVPAAAIVVALILALATWLDPRRILEKLPSGAGRMIIAGSKITMEAPRMSGFTADGRAYDLIAAAAAQEITKPDIIELQEIRAKVEMADKAIVNMTAVTGVYNAKAELLTLNEYIVLVSSTGYEAYLTEAFVDIRKGQIISEKPVEVKLLNGVINSNRLEVIDSGDLVRFDGGVVMKVHFDGDAAKGPDAKAAAR